MDSPLHALLERPDIWQASRGQAASNTQAALPTGHPALDHALYLGGWPRAALSELLADDCGIGEMQLLAPALAQCSQGPRRLFLVGSPHLPYAPALQAFGVRLEQLRIVASGNAAETLWCAEQILRSGACGCLLAWLPETRQADFQALRRLQLAARASSGPAFLFRPARGSGTSSPAALRLGLRSSAQNLVLDIVKQRGGPAGQQVLLPRPAGLLQTRLQPAMLPVVTPPQSSIGKAAGNIRLWRKKPAATAQPSLH